ncbi:MAG: hypothetical protein R3E87_26810 [Burkholderiaceae bacterium]
MITYIRIANAQSGKLGAATAAASSLAAYLKRRHDLEVTVHVPVGGNPNRVCWTAQFADLAGLERFMEASMADPEYAPLVAEVAKNLINGATTDEILKSL